MPSPAGDCTTPVSSSTTSPPSVSIGVGKVRLGLIEMSSRENGAVTIGRVKSVCLPIGSGLSVAMASLCASTVARSPAGSMPA